MRSRRRLARAALLLLLSPLSGCARNATEAQRQTWSAEIQRLETEQDSLRARAAELVATDPRLMTLPRGDVVISVPTIFLRTVIQRVLGDVVENVTLRLSGIKAHVAKTVKKVIKIGEFVLDVEVHEVTGKLKLSAPDIQFGADRISLSLPIALAEGHGEATLHFIWDGKNVAGLTCGDMDVTEKLTATVVPANYTVSGSMSLAVVDNAILCTPVFPETRIRLRVQPSREAWATVNALLEEKHGVCGWVLDKVDVPGILEGIIQEKGINVKLPVDKIRPFLIPAGVQDSLTVGDDLFIFKTRTTTLRIEPDAILYSADVEMKAP